jgi:hypothetical protein
MTLKSKNITRPPIGTFDEDADLVGLARTVAEEFEAMEDGHHAQLRAFLGRAYLLYRLFQQVPGAYAQLKQEPFWECSRQKPRDLTTSKHVLLFVMRAETPNVRTRASKYAKIVDGLARERASVSQVPECIKALGGVEAAYAHFVTVERGPTQITVDADDEKTENERPLIPRKGGMRAARGGNDDKVQGDVEAESTSENSLGTAVGERRRMPSFDPERCLIVELESDALEAILAAGTTQGAPVTFQLEITVHPCDARGFVRVLGEPEPSDLPEDFLSIDPAGGPSHTSPFNGKPVPPPVRPERPLGKGGKSRPWMGRPTSIFAK